MSEEETKSLIRSCLISTKGSLSLRELKKDFHTLVGGVIPFRDYGFRSLEDYLRSIPDVVRVRGAGADIQLQFVADESTAGIASLVQRQRDAKKRAAPRRPHLPPARNATGRRWGGFSAPRFNVNSQRTVNVRPSPRPAGSRPPAFQRSPAPAPRPPRPPPPAAAAPGRVPPAPPASRDTSAAAEMPPSARPASRATSAAAETLPSARPASRATSAVAETLPSARPGSRAAPASRGSPSPVAEVGVPLPAQYRAQNKPQRQTAPPPPPSAPAPAPVAVDPAALRPQQASEAGARAWWGGSASAMPARVTTPTGSTGPTNAQPDRPQTDSSPSGPVEELRQFIQLHRLPEAKLEMVSFRPKKGRLITYYSTIEVGEIKCQTYPAESPSVTCAEQMACQLALEELRAHYQDPAVRDSPVTDDPQLLVARIAKILESRPNGLWRDSLSEKYRQRFGERVPDDWEDHAFNSGQVRFDCIGVDRYILYPTTQVSIAGGAAENGDAGAAAPRASPVPADGRPAAPGPCGDSLTCMETAALPDEDLFPVYVTWVLSGSQLAFRIIGENNTDLLDDLLTEMEVAVVDNAQPVTPVIGGLYIASVDGTPHRVQVVDILDDMVSAFFVDIGDTELVPAGCLSALDGGRFGRLPGQALHARLSGVDGHRPGAKEALSRLTLRQSLICQVVEAGEGRLEVILFDTSGEDDVNINQQLRELSETAAAPRLPAAGGLSDAFIVHVPPDGDHLYIQLDSGSSAELNERVAAAGEAAAPRAPAAAPPGHLVLARYADGGWYRARVLQPPQDGAVSVLFVDYGNCDSVAAADVRQLPAELAAAPAQALPVRLSGVALSAEQAVRLIEMVPMDGTRVVVRVTAAPADGVVPQVEAYKRLDNNELVSINATLLIAPSSRPESAARQNSASSLEARAGPTPTPSLQRPPSSAASTVAPSPTELLQRQLSLTSPPPAPAQTSVSRQQSAPSPTEQVALLSASEGDERAPLQQYRVQQGDGYLDVSVSFCSSPWNIFIQPYLEGGHLQALMRSMQDYYNQSTNRQQLRPAEVASGRVCAVRKPDDDIWYRARVETRLDNAQITIKFVDYGDFGYVPLDPSHVQPLPAAFRRLPAQAVKARLGGVRPVGSDWTFDDCVALQQLLGCGAAAFCAQLLQLSIDPITGEQLIVVRLVDTSDPGADLYVDRMLVNDGHAVHTGEFFTS